MKKDSNTTYYFYRNVIQERKKIKNNLLIIDSLDNIYSLDFNDIFLMLDNNSKILLDNIYDYSISYNYGKYIDKKSFINFIINSNNKIPTMEQTYIISEFDNEDNFTLDHNGKRINIVFLNNDILNNSQDIKRKKIFKIKSNNIEEKIKTNISTKNNDYIFSVNKLNYSNGIDFLLAFLNWLFSTEDCLYIKKCQVCNHYYVANKADYKYCKGKRIIDNEEYSCNIFVSNFKKTYKYKKFKKQDKSFQQKINHNRDISGTYLEDYIEKRNNIISEAVKKNDLDLLLNFIDNYELENPIV